MLYSRVENAYVKNKIINIFGFWGLTISFSAIQLCHGSRKADTEISN